MSDDGEGVVRYRKRPVVVEAEQFSPHKDHWPTGVMASGDSPTGYAIKTLEGLMVVSPGDFIITGVQGELYPCKPDIFHASYERMPLDGTPTNGRVPDG